MKKIMNLPRFTLICILVNFSIFYNHDTRGESTSETAQPAPSVKNFPLILDDSEIMTNPLPQIEEESISEDSGIDSENSMPPVAQNICPPCTCPTKS